MDLGIVLGALLAALLAGRFAPVWSIPARSLAAAVLGGLLLGYGARVAYGCNIGAYFSGIASGSLHGWLWLPAAFLGNVLGHVSTPDLRPERRTDRVAEVLSGVSAAQERQPLALERVERSPEHRRGAGADRRQRLVAAAATADELEHRWQALAIDEKADERPGVAVAQHLVRDGSKRRRGRVAGHR